MSGDIQDIQARGSEKIVTNGDKGEGGGFEGCHFCSGASFEWLLTLKTHHVCSTLKRRGNKRFHVAPTWNTRGVFVRKPQQCNDRFTTNFEDNLNLIRRFRNDIEQLFLLHFTPLLKLLS